MDHLLEIKDLGKPARQVVPILAPLLLAVLVAPTPVHHSHLLPLPLTRHHQDNQIL